HRWHVASTLRRSRRRRGGSERRRALGRRLRQAIDREEKRGVHGAPAPWRVASLRARRGGRRIDGGPLPRLALISSRPCMRLPRPAFAPPWPEPSFAARRRSSSLSSPPLRICLSL